MNGKYVMASTDYDSDNMPFIGASGLGAYYGLGYMSRNTNTLNADVVLNQKLDMITKGLSFKLKALITATILLPSSVVLRLLIIHLFPSQMVLWNTVSMAMIPSLDIVRALARAVTGILRLV